MARWTKELFHLLVNLNDQLVGPIALYTRPGTYTEALNMVKVWEAKGYSNSPDTCHRPTGRDAEGTRPYCPWSKNYLLESAVDCSPVMG